MNLTGLTDLPDSRGHFGPYGGISSPKP